MKATTNRVIWQTAPVIGSGSRFQPNRSSSFPISKNQDACGFTGLLAIAFVDAHAFTGNHYLVEIQAQHFLDAIWSEWDSMNEHLRAVPQIRKFVYAAST
jgi:hypothetical protein